VNRLVIGKEVELWDITKVNIKRRKNANAKHVVKSVKRRKKNIPQAKSIPVVRSILLTKSILAERSTLLERNILPARSIVPASILQEKNIRLGIGKDQLLCQPFSFDKIKKGL
jgi:hypothetical protein